MPLIDDVRDAKQRFGAYVERFQRLLHEYKVEGRDWYASLKLANGDPAFATRRNAIWNELLEQESGKLTLPVVLGIIGATLGGIGIAGFGSAIGLPLALLLAPVGLLLGNELDGKGISKGVVRRIRQFFGSSELKGSQDDAAPSANEELGVLLELLTETTTSFDGLAHAHGELATRCEVIEQENETLRADVTKLSDQLTLLRSPLEVAQAEIATLRRRTVFLCWVFLILGLVLISQLVVRFLH